MSVTCCPKCQQPLEAGQTWCSNCGLSIEADKPKKDRMPIPIWIVVIIFLVPLATCGACFAGVWTQNEPGYEFLNIPMQIEVVSVVIGTILLGINIKYVLDKDIRK